MTPTVSERVQIVPAIGQHVRLLKDHLRVGDRQECEGAGFTPQEVLWRSYRWSFIAKTAFVDGEIAAMWGCGANPFSTVGFPWLLTGYGVEKFPLTFIKRIRQEVGIMIDIYPSLEGKVDATYTQACRMLRLMGFTLSAPAPFGGDRLYCTYRMER